ncbi:hypothetical protein DIR46_07360 [Massilia oculi]|uniref:Uncharacterized protein n=1 Tax=Massilia oculi TaxID=945844 RepID=A0A2S2DGR3_9BURK|nr:hypothetical protein DIR46_07360 [Massilia oculi]
MPEQVTFFMNSVGWLMGLEPTTTGITIQQRPMDFRNYIKALRFWCYNGDSTFCGFLPYEGNGAL